MRRRLLALCLVALAAACGSDDDPAVETPAAVTTAPDAPTPTAATSPEPTGADVVVTVAGGKVVSGGGRVKVATGDEVRLVVRSDVADEVHVHGYDREFAVPAGGEGSVTFVADLEGVWEVELHDAGLTLVELEVS